MTLTISFLFVLTKTTQLINKILISFSFCVFLFQPAILNALFEIVKCKDLYPDPGKSFIFNYMSEECYTENYFKWVFLMVIPGLLFYAILFPLFFNCYIKIGSIEGKDPIDFLKLNYILKQGFRKDKCHW